MEAENPMNTLEAPCGHESAQGHTCDLATAHRWGPRSCEHSAKVGRNRVWWDHAGQQVPSIPRKTA